MTSRTVTIDVPKSLFELLQRRAGQTRRSVEDEVIYTLASTLEDGQLPEDIETMLAALSSMDDVTLWRLARSQVPEEDARRLSELADQRQRTGLSAAELQDAELLADRHDRVLAVRAEAAAALRKRGIDVTALLPGR